MQQLDDSDDEGSLNLEEASISSGQPWKTAFTQWMEQDDSLGVDQDAVTWWGVSPIYIRLYS